MEVDYGILEEFNVNKEEALTHVDNSGQVKKYVVAICNKDIIKSIRTKKAKGLKELLRNINEWKCSTCNIQLYSGLNYKKHLTGAEHKAKLNGLKEAIVCSMANCRKKFGSNEELEEHLQYSPKCRKSPTNENKSNFIKMKSKWERYKELYSLFRESKETMTDLDKKEYNQMLINDYNGNEEYELVKDELGFLVVKPKEKQIEELKYTKKDITIKPDTTEEDTRTHEEIYEAEHLQYLIEQSNIEEARIKKEEARLEEFRSELRSDKFLGGPSSDSEYEEIELSSDEQ